MMTDTERGTDSLILPFLRETDEREARRLLEEIVSRQADPIIKGVIARQARTDAGRRATAWRPLEAEAVQGETVAQLVTRLEALRERDATRAEAPIADLRRYVAGLALRNCQSWLRRLFPRRARLRNRLRYLLSHDARFLLRPSPGEGWLCGLRDRDAAGDRDGDGALPQVDDAAPAEALLPSDAPTTRAVAADPSPAGLSSLARDLLARAGRPVDLEFLVDAVARRCGLEEAPGGRASAGQDRTSPRRPAARPPRESSRDPRDRLRALWEELLVLPPLQRSVLLLNLRDGRGQGLIGVFPVAGVAGIRRIAIALDQRPDRFAELWKQLPLDDDAIAARLRLSRSQVIDLRRAAHRSLARRLSLD